MVKTNIGIELRSLSNLVMRYIENNAHKKLIDTITGTNGWIIGYLAENKNHDVYQRDLEQEFGITRSTISKVINLMVKKGLLERQGVPHDARLKKLVLTPKSLDIADMMTKDREKLETILTQGFQEDELANLYNYIERMKRNIQ